MVVDPAPGWQPDTTNPTRRVFEHWLFMSGRSPRRCKLGPTRSQAINGALAMGYDEDTLLLAIEGMAADPLQDVTLDRIRDAMREVEWLLGREARIERWAEAGERLRAQAADDAARPVVPVHDDVARPPTAEEQAAAAQARARIQALAARLRTGGQRG